MSDPIQTPTEPSIPSAAGIVAKGGKSPLPRALDLDGDGVPDYQQHWFWDKFYGALGSSPRLTSPNSGFATYVNRYGAVAQGVIDRELPR
jgi:hypothetical protein